MRRISLAMVVMLTFGLIIFASCTALAQQAGGAAAPAAAGATSAGTPVNGAAGANPAANTSGGANTAATGPAAATIGGNADRGSANIGAGNSNATGGNGSTVVTGERRATGAMRGVAGQAVPTGNQPAGRATAGRRFNNQNQGISPNPSRAATRGTGRPAAATTRQVPANRAPVAAGQMMQSTTTMFPQGRRLFNDNSAANQASSDAAAQANQASATQNSRAAARTNNPNLGNENVTSSGSSANGAGGDDLHNFGGPSAAANVTNSAAARQTSANSPATPIINSAGATTPTNAGQLNQPFPGAARTVVNPVAPRGIATASVNPLAADQAGAASSANIQGERRSRTTRASASNGIDSAFAPPVVTSTGPTSAFAPHLGFGFDTSNESLLLATVPSGTWAARMGFTAGDRIVAINGQTVEGFNDLTNYITANPTGRTMLDVERNGQIEQLPLDVGSLNRAMALPDLSGAVTAGGRPLAGTAAAFVRAARMRAAERTHVPAVQNQSTDSSTSDAGNNFSIPPQ